MFNLDKMGTKDIKLLRHTYNRRTSKFIRNIIVEKKLKTLNMDWKAPVLIIAFLSLGAYSLELTEKMKNDAMDLLEPHIVSGLGLALQATNDGYWSRHIPPNNDPPLILAHDDIKSPKTKFLIEKVGDNIIRMVDDYSGKYLYTDDRLYLWADKISPDTDCNFEVYEFEGKLVLRHPVTQKFLNSMKPIPQVPFFLVFASDGVCESCRFEIETAAILPVKEEITSLTWGELDLGNLTPKLAASKTVVNSGSETAQETVSVKWSYTESSETVWEVGWGVTTGVSFTQSINAILEEESFTFSLEVNFNGKKGGNYGESKTMEISESTTVKIPAGKKVTVNLMVNIKEDSVVPYEAEIRRTSEIGTQEFTERGIWKGVMKFDSYLTIEESDA